jgi:hypothetical protein
MPQGSADRAGWHRKSHIGVNTQIVGTRQICNVYHDSNVGKRGADLVLDEDNAPISTDAVFAPKGIINHAPKTPCQDVSRSSHLDVV